VHLSDQSPFFENIVEIAKDGLEVEVLLFADLELASEEFDLLSEVNEFLFESLSVSEGGFEVVLVFRSLGRFVTEEGLEFSDTLSKKSVVLLAFAELNLNALVFHDGYFVFLDLSTKGIDLLVLGVDGFSESSNLLLKSWDLVSEDLSLVQVRGELNDDLLFLLEDLLVSLELLSEILNLALQLWDLSCDLVSVGEVGLELKNGGILFLDDLLESLDLRSKELDLAFKSRDGADLTLKFADLLLESSNFLLISSNLSAHELDLLGEVDELLLEGLSFSATGIEIVEVLGSLDTFFVDQVVEFLDLLDEESVVALRLSELSFELLESQ